VCASGRCVTKIYYMPNKLLTAMPPNIQTKGNQPRILDLIASALLGLILIVPYANLRLAPGLLLLDVLDLLLVFIALAIQFTRAVPGLALTAWIFLGLLFVAHIAVAGSSHHLREALSQGRMYAPLIAGSVLMAARLRVSRPDAICLLALTTSFSAIFATATHWLGPDAVVQLAGNIPQTEVVRNEGRMYWFSATAALCVPLVLSTRANPMFAWTTVVTCGVGVALTMSRTLIVAYVVVFVAGVLLSRSFKALALTTAVLLGCVTAMYFALERGALSEKVLDTARTRFTSSEKEVDRALFGGRVPLYEQYQERLLESGGFGQGLGPPMATLEGKDIFSTDVSLLSMWIPFGLPGVVALILVLASTFQLTLQETNVALRSHFLVLLLVGCAASLNYDLWTRNSFVIAVAFIAASRDWGTDPPLMNRKSTQRDWADATPPSGQSLHAISNLPFTNHDA